MDNGVMGFHRNKGRVDSSLLAELWPYVMTFIAPVKKMTSIVIETNSPFVVGMLTVADKDYGTLKFLMVLLLQVPPCQSWAEELLRASAVVASLPSDFFFAVPGNQAPRASPSTSLLFIELQRLTSSGELFTTSMDLAFVHRTWEKWASNHVGSSGQPLKAALLINYDPTGPSRLLSTIAEQEGIKADPTELSQFIGFFKRNKLQSESFFVGPNQYIVTSIHENWFCARSMNTTKPAGEGAIVMQTAAFLLVALYDGSIGSASRAMVVVDQLAHGYLGGRRSGTVADALAGVVSGLLVGLFHGLPGAVSALEIGGIGAWPLLHGAVLKFTIVSKDGGQVSDCHGSSVTANAGHDDIVDRRSKSAYFRTLRMKSESMKMISSKSWSLSQRQSY
ncbi:hypothetical protein Vadar_012973 [Vaccinium darrowii]|uniref:Uncharacterized protein n=1 Tax=Vaccinium darrowii TaxID=229202 RepID=A0ACB7XQA0_9ERIC|nr:hypothetical protein Vadar_012973 [Vaccinium darrowii]